jgi:hypothetical protein
VFGFKSYKGKGDFVEWRIQIGNDIPADVSDDPFMGPERAVQASRTLTHWGF